MAGGMTYYAVLGVAENAGFEAIHNAFRALARQYHPDAGEGSSAGKFREIVEAYDTLGDPERRQAYDRMLAREQAPAPRPEAPRREVIVEPLAQPWFASTRFSSPGRGVNARSATVQFGRAAVMDDWLEEVFRSFFSDPWFAGRFGGR